MPTLCPRRYSLQYCRYAHTAVGLQQPELSLLPASNAALALPLR